MADFRPRSSLSRHAAAAVGLQGQGRLLWHRAAAMNLLADVLLLFSAIALGYALVVWFLNRSFFPLREVVLVTQPRQVSVEQVEYAARSVIHGNFFSVKLDEVRDSFEKLPWVRHAEVRRQWPDAIELRIEEQDAVAYWVGDGSDEVSLVNAKGEVFTATSKIDMPWLIGPQGSAPYMLKRYHEFSEQLQPLDKRLSELWLSAREAWQLKLDDGLVVLLGRDQPRSPIEQRLDRFIKVWPETQMRNGIQAAVADLRYQGGFALMPVVEMKAVKGK